MINQAVLTPDTKSTSKGIIFSGYAATGAHYSDGDKRYVEVGSSGKSLGRWATEAETVARSSRQNGPRR